MKPALRIIIFVMIMGSAAGVLLIGVNLLTAPLVEKNEELKLKGSVLDALEVPYESSKIISVFDDKIKVFKKSGYTFYVAPDGSFAFEFHGPGLWGAITGIISLEKDTKTIRKLKVTHQEETPGLGGRIAEEAYLKQFKNKIVLPRLIFVAEGESRKNNEVDAITGATGSSRAFEKLLNENVQQYLSVFKGG